MQNYRIIAKPNLTNVIRGKVMSFSLQRINPDAPLLEHVRASWHCYNHVNYYKQDKYRGKYFIGPRNSTEWHNATWNVEGQHIVVCEIKYSDKIEYIEHMQNVISAKETVSYSSLTIEESENPFIFYKNLTKQIAWIREQEKQQQLSDEDEKAYQDRMKTLDQFKEKLKFLLEKVPTDCRENFGQMHVKHIASIYNDREDMSLRVGYFYNDKQVYIVDWTSPLDRIFCGVYVGNGENREEAVQQAIACWDKDNRYPEGVIRGYAAVAEASGVAKEVTSNDDNQIIFGKDIIFGGIEINFDTDGKSDLDAWSDALASIGLAMAIVGGVITLIAPVPGSRAVSALIWSSIATSTASSVINIADRHREGFGNWKDDSFDILTIAGNIFSAGTLAAGSKWTSKILSLGNISQKQAVKISLIGQITSDTMQGVLLTEELASAIYSVMSNKALPADVKLSQISSLMTRGLIDGVLLTVNLRGNANHFSAVNNKTTPIKKMSQEEINQYISNNKSFSKVDIETILPKGHSETASPKNSPSQIPSKDEVRQYRLPAPPNTVSNIVEEIKSITPYTKEMHNSKIISAKIPNDKGIREPFSAVLSPEWQLAYLEENRAKAVSDDYFEQLLYRSSEIGKEPSSLKVKKGEISDTIETDSIKREDNTSHPESETTKEVKLKPKEKGKGQQELEEELIAWKEQGIDPNKIKDRVALAQTRCEVEGIVSQANFYNLDMPKYVSLKKGENPIVRAIDETYYEILNVEAYMDLLEESYKSSKTLYPSVTPEFAAMHPQTKKLIAEFIAKNKKFRILDGLPGMHAEVLSTNNVFHQLTAKGKDPALYLDKIEVSTIRLTKHKQSEAFPACRHCSGILSKSKGISIPTGRVDD